MGIGRVIAGTAAGLGLVGAGYTGLAGQDDTTRNDTGAIVESGELGAFRIRVGDCLDSALGDEVESVEGIPCSNPHGFEVYHAFNLPEGDGSFPGDATVGSAADDGCLAAFDSFVGIDYWSSSYDFVTLVPTEGSWDGLDDREVLCLLTTVDGTPLTGSAAGTAR
jgi:hypothetical protein